MREISCPVCGGTRRVKIYDATLPPDSDKSSKPPPPYSAHYQINRCAGCGLVYSSPIMDAEGVTILYRDASETNVLPGEERNVERTMEGYYRLAAPHLPGRQRILDVGCDMGFLLKAAEKDGFAELYGVEPNPIARALAEQIPGAQISHRFYESADYPPDYFDLLTLIHVLDHLVDPRITLASVRRNLRPGGITVAVVHNLRSMLGRVLGERFPVFNLYHHFFFDKSSLSELFRRHGFEVIDVVSTRNCYSLGFFAERLPGCPAIFHAGLTRGLKILGLARLSISIPVGNIGIVARRPS